MSCDKDGVDLPSLGKLNFPDVVTIENEKENS
jgi:hypothetical protein